MCSARLMNRSRFRLLVTMSTGLVMIHVVCGAEIGLHPSQAPCFTYAQFTPVSTPCQDSGVGSRKVWGLHWGAAWNGGTSAQQVVCLTRACREISREFPSLITHVLQRLVAKIRIICRKTWLYLYVLWLLGYSLFGRKRILGEQQSIE